MAIINNNSKDTKWKKYGENSYELEKCPKLEHELIINNPQVINKNIFPSKTYTVIGNGIEIIVDSDMKKLMDTSILCYDKVIVENKVYPIPVTYIISASLRSALTENNILLDYIYPMFHENQQNLFNKVILKEN